MPTPLSFPPPTEEQLARLGPGCFVKIGEDNDLFWVEITDVAKEEFTGVIYEVLNDSVPEDYAQGCKVQFCKQHINGLGCDYLCFC